MAKQVQRSGRIAASGVDGLSLRPLVELFPRFEDFAHMSTRSSRLVKSLRGIEKGDIDQRIAGISK